MPLHPQLQALQAQRVAAAMTLLYELSVEQARAADLAAIQAEAGTPEPVARVQDRTISGLAGDLPIRVYAVAGRGPLPVLVYLFGGGWVLGTIDTSDAICRRLANAARCVVVAVGYRLAPEHRFPAAVQDCYAATCWVAAHADQVGGDPARIAVGGDSAGGNLAAVVAQLARDRGRPPPVQQVLVYPITDYLPDTESARLAAAGVPVECTRYDGIVHGFVGMTGILDDARRALDQIAVTLRRAFDR